MPSKADPTDPIHWISELETRIEKAEGFIPSEQRPDFFECIAGPFLSRRLMPSIERPNYCRFLSTYLKSRKDFYTKVAMPLFGRDVLSTGEQFCAANDSLIGRMQEISGRRDISPPMRLLRGVELRIATLLALEHIQTDKGIFIRLVKAYQKYFSTSCWNEVPAYSDPELAIHKSAAWGVIHSNNEQLAKRIHEDLEKENISFLDPAAAMLIDTICEASGWSDALKRPFKTEELKDGASWLVGDTWVLVVLPSKHTADRGIVMRLRVEPIEFHLSGRPIATIGAFYPHPHLGAFMHLNSTFQQSIRNAWLANHAGSKTSASIHTDYRWSLIPWDDSTTKTTKLDDWCEAYPKIRQEGKDWREYSNERDRYHCLWSSLAGQSATLAYAISLKSCKEERYLCKDLAATATFEVPQQDCNKLSHNPLLGPVDGIPAKRRALDRVYVRALIVSSEQTVKLPLEEGEWNKKLSFLDAYQTAIEFEEIIHGLATRAGSNWSEISKATGEGTLQDEHRFDLYVPPEYAWQDPNPKFDLDRTGKEPRWLSVPLGGAPEDQLQRALQEAYRKHQNIVLVDAAGAGKTISAYKIQELLSSDRSRKDVFGDTPPKAVLLWTSRLPKTNKSQPQFRELLCADPTIESASKKSKIIPEDLVEYLIESKRLVIVVDAYDELSEARGSDEKKILQSVYQEKDAEEVFWIVTGREYAIEQSSGTGNLFAKFRRLQIVSFSEDLQNRYMEGFLATHKDKQKLKDHFGSNGWRSCLLGSGTPWDELLGLPHTLRSITKILELWDPDLPIPNFSSPSDLFFQTGEEMLRRELRKQLGMQVEIDGKQHEINPCCYLLECALGAVAFEMATRNHWRYVPGSGRQLTAEIEDVLKCAKERFLRSKVAFLGLVPGEVWTWAVDIMDHFMSYGGALGAQKGDRVLSFTTRRIQEMRAALFMTQYAHPTDLRNEEHWLSSARGHSGDANWQELWLAAIRMPIEDASMGSKGVDVQQYARVMEVLFERPYICKQSDEPNAPRAQRRPTELMWECDRWIKRSIQIGFKSLISDFEETKRSPNDFKTRVKRLDIHLRDHLGKQFAEILRGTNKRSEVARDLIDLKNFVILADPDKPIDKFDTGRFEKGIRKKVSVELSKFGLCKCTLSNEQYWLFDDNYFASEQTWLFERDYRSRFAPSASDAPEDILKAWYGRLEDFKGPHQPAVFVSWYDSYWYSEFVNGGVWDSKLGRRGWRVQLPTEAQWEYGARAGGKRNYFRGKGLLRNSEVTETDFDRYAHFDQRLETGKTFPVRGDGKLPNAWGLKMILGNASQWVYDVYEEDLPSGVDPVRHEPLLSEGSGRVLRGGAWHRYSDCGSALRRWNSPDSRSNDLGFRLALSSSGIPRLDEQS